MNKFLTPDIQESDIIPYHTSPPIGERVLVLAPHPDDETLGCGGSLKMLIASGKAVKVVFLTSGDKADPEDPRCLKRHDKPHITDYSLMREREAVNALNVIGAEDYGFLRFPDRELFSNYESVLKQLSAILSTFMPDAIYCTSPIELNPDHRASAKVALDLLRSGAIEKVIFYEVTVPLMPNLLVDITDVYIKKQEAIQQFGSQLRITDYLGHIKSLNKIRTLTVPPAQYVEGFLMIDKLVLPNIP